MRNKNITKEKILDAAELILARDGFSCLKVNMLAKEAGVGKPLIYRYFANIDGVVRELSERCTQRASVDILGASSSEVVRELLAGGRGLAADRLTRDLLLWELSSGGGVSSLKGLLDLDGDQLERDTRFDGDDKRATYVILKAAIAFMVLYRDRHDSWAGLPIKTPNNMARLESALARLVEKTW